MSGVEVVVALVIAVGLVGIVLPVLPGDWLILAAVLFWASETGGRTAWLVTATAAALLVVGAVIKYAVPGRRLKAAGVPTSSLVVGGVLGVIGFFVIPVVGLVLGFVLGVWLAEARRLGSREATPATGHALRAVGLAILIEFTFALAAAIVWGVGVVIT